MSHSERTRFHLIRHAETDFPADQLAGRLPAVHLNDIGRQRAHCLAQYLARQDIQRIVSSPLERCLQTAEPLAKILNFEIQIMDEFTEIDFGSWTGKRITELDQLESWKQWNTFRSGARVPGGESMGHVQRRMISGIEELRRKFAGESIALLSHGDLIRAAITYYLGLPLDLLLRLEISHASLSTLTLDGWSARLQCCNFTVPANFDP